MSEMADEYMVRQEELRRRSYTHGRVTPHGACLHTKCDVCEGRTKGRCKDKNFVDESGNPCSNKEFHKQNNWCNCAACFPEGWC